MAEDADTGFILWDGQSLGSIQNLFELLDRGKPATVYLSPAAEFYSIATWEELRPLYEASPDKTKRLFEERFGPFPSDIDPGEATQMTMGF